MQLLELVKQNSCGCGLSKPFFNGCRGRNSALVEASGRFRKWRLWLRQVKDVTPPEKQRRCRVPPASIAFEERVEIDDFVVGRPGERPECTLQVSAHRRGIGTAPTRQEHQRRRAIVDSTSWLRIWWRGTAAGKQEQADDNSSIEHL